MRRTGQRPKMKTKCFGGEQVRDMQSCLEGSGTCGACSIGEQQAARAYCAEGTLLHAGVYHMHFAILWFAP